MKKNCKKNYEFDWDLGHRHELCLVKIFTRHIE